MLVASICLSSYRPFEVSRECSFVESEAFLLMEKQAESVLEMVVGVVWRVERLVRREPM